MSLAAWHWGGAAETSPDVVLVHGLASTARLWDGVAAALVADGRAVTALDLRGHGESDAPECGYDTATAADDVVAALDELVSAPVVLAGQSWGGNVALQVAARAPRLVAGLVLVDGGWIDLQRAFPSWDDALAALTPPPIDGMDAEAFRSLVAGSLTGFPPGAVDAATSVVRVRDDQTIARRLTVPRHLQILRSLWEDDPSRWYPHVRCPVVLMPAVADETLPDPVLAAAEALTTVVVRPAVGAHHDIHLQRPGDVAAEIRSLLS